MDIQMEYRCSSFCMTYFFTYLSNNSLTTCLKKGLTHV